MRGSIEDRRNAAQDRRDSRKAIIDENVGNPGQLLNLIGKSGALGRDETGIDDQIGMQPSSGCGHALGTHPGPPAQHRHAVAGNSAAPSRAAQRSDLLRRQHKHQDLGGRACRHHPLDRLGQHDSAACGVNELGGTRRTRIRHKRGQQQKQRRAPALPLEPRGGRAKRHRNPQSNRELVLPTITSAIVRANPRPGKSATRLVRRPGKNGMPRRCSGG